MFLCLVRHGQTNWNTRSLLQGLTDNELNETGKMQAKQVGLYLKEHYPNWDVYISSPLTRAIQTGTIIKEILESKENLIIDKNFIERDFGELEGQILNDAMYDLLEKEISKGLESFKDLQKRSLNAVLNLEKKYPNKRVIVFSHAQFIKSLITQLDPNFNFRSLLRNSSMHFFEVKDGKIEIIEYNVVAK